jgi:1-pyrroline-5-carboxylate dehydrogenase
VVGQQPFGGARASGTNDKAGAASYLLRFASPQSVKENLLLSPAWDYPHMRA